MTVGFLCSPRWFSAIFIFKESDRIGKNYDKRYNRLTEKQTNLKYIDWLNSWLENYVRPSVKVRTYERYRLIIEQHKDIITCGLSLDKV